MPIVELEAALDDIGVARTSDLESKVDKISGKGLSTEDYTSGEKTKLAEIESNAQANPATISQAEAEAGSATTLRSWTAQRVRQAIAAWWGGTGRRVSINPQSADYAFTLADDVVTHPAADATARAWTVPDGFPVGTLLTVDNQIGAGVITLSSASDVLQWVGSGATGSRTVAAGGQATLLKVGVALWRVGGVGVS